MGKRTDGIRTPQDLRERCKVTEAGCWVWGGARDSNGRPSFWFGALGATVSLGVAACWWTTGRRPAKGEAWHCVCTTPDCGNPEHRVCGTRASQMLALGMVRTPQQRARIAVAKRKVAKLTDAAVAEIRGAKETLAVLAERHGICVQYACQLRSGKRRAYALTDDVRVVVAAPQQRREQKAPSIFGPIGSYAESGSAVSRAYGSSA